MEGMVGRMLHLTLGKVREIPRAEYLFWVAFIIKYGDGSGIIGK